MVYRAPKALFVKCGARTRPARRRDRQVDIDVLVPHQGERQAARVEADAIGARFAGRAHVAAGATVVDVRLGQGADTGTHGGVGGTSAHPGVAHFVERASVAAGAAVGGVRHQVRHGQGKTQVARFARAELGRVQGGID